MALEILFYIIIGIIEDIIVTLYYQAIAKEKEWWAGIMSFIVGVSSMTIFFIIFSGITEKDYIPILSVCAGNGIGTFLVTRFARKGGFLRILKKGLTKQ